MSHLRTHSTAASVVSTAPPPAVSAALAQALMSTAPMMTSTTPTSALAALQAQAVKLATSTAPVPSTPAPTPATPTTTAPAVDLAAAAAARYHAALATTRPGFPPAMGIPPGALPPHLASLYGLGNPYNTLPMLYPMP